MKSVFGKGIFLSIYRGVQLPFGGVWFFRRDLNPLIIEYFDILNVGLFCPGLQNGWSSCYACLHKSPWSRPAAVSERQVCRLWFCGGVLISHFEWCCEHYQGVKGGSVVDLGPDRGRGNEFCYHRCLKCIQSAGRAKGFSAARCEPRLLSSTCMS